MANKQEINTGIFAESADNGIVISGWNTFYFKDAIKEMGGKWRADSKTWVLPLTAVLGRLMPALPPWVCCHAARNLDYTNKCYMCPTHYPKGKNPWWFCGHADARITSMKLQMHTCRTCAGPDSYGCSYVKGMNYAQND